MNEAMPSWREAHLSFVAPQAWRSNPFSYPADTGNSYLLADCRGLLVSGSVWSAFEGFPRPLGDARIKNEEKSPEALALKPEARRRTAHDSRRRVHGGMHLQQS